MLIITRKLSLLYQDNEKNSYPKEMAMKIHTHTYIYLWPFLDFVERYCILPGNTAAPG